MAPRETIWPIDEHTRGKHLVLKYYLDAWMAILGNAHGRVVFIDGFAGPGRYTGGEPGSPIVAMQAIRGHIQRATWDAALLFVEADPDRCAVLQIEVAKEQATLPSSVSVQVECGDFAPTVNELLDGLAAAGIQLAPSFMMVDPFGISGAPMSIIRRFLASPRSEVLVTFMVDFIDRFDETKEFPLQLDDLYGTPRWRDFSAGQPKPQRVQAYFDLYESQLRAAGATSVLRFDLYTGNRLLYGLFHASKHLKACQRMKQAIWRADPTGEFAFRGSRSGQLDLLFGADMSGLEKVVRGYLAGRDWVTREELWDFVNSDETDYHSDQIRREALIPLEDQKAIEVYVEGKRKVGTYPEKRTRIRLRR